MVKRWPTPKTTANIAVSVGPELRVFPANTKQLYSICTMLDQRRRRWPDVVQMLYPCFVFAGM